MKIPELNIINTPDDQFFLYSAADSKYFDLHGKALINSVLKNTSYSIHIHIINPTKQQLQWCESIARLSVSVEHFDTNIFSEIAELWSTKTVFNNHRERQMYDKGRLFGISEMAKIIEKTYYACSRFIRLKDIKPNGSSCLALDVDGLVRGNFSVNFGPKDIYLYQKKSGEHLAGAILFTPTSDNFLHDYGDIISQQIKKDNLYWFLDQVVLDEIVPKYSTGLLPMSYIDWEMSPTSAIWSAKGKRKADQIFIVEQKKYSL